jgi:hypothetical protein
MGNNLSIDFCYNPFDTRPLCYYCKKKIDPCHLVKCVRCGITLHYNCEENKNHYEGRQFYTKCPNCDKKGSLGISFEN